MLLRLVGLGYQSVQSVKWLCSRLACWPKEQLLAYIMVQESKLDNVDPHSYNPACSGQCSYYQTATTE